jgi:hypothetical protein
VESNEDVDDACTVLSHGMKDERGGGVGAPFGSDSPCTPIKVDSPGKLWRAGDDERTLKNVQDDLGVSMNGTLHIVTRLPDIVCFVLGKSRSGYTKYKARGRFLVSSHRVGRTVIPCPNQTRRFIASG